MRDDDRTAAGPLWALGEMTFRISGPGPQTAADRLVKVGRPYALVGRGDDADVAVDDRSVNARHAYLHADARGVFAVDLVTRSGTRINGTGRMVGWLRPGDWIEVAGRRLELVRLRVDGSEIDPPPCDSDMLAGVGNGPLAAVTLEPGRADESPWVLGSELVFLGGSAACGIRVADPDVSRIHCAFLRSTAGAFLVDLVGRQTRVNGRPVRVRASAVSDGDEITLGSTRFVARVEPPPPPPQAPALLPQVIPRDEAGAFLNRPPTLDPGLLPAEAQHALAAWVSGMVQGGQGEIFRRQGEFQLAVAQALHEMRQDNAALLHAQLDRIDGIGRELAALRAEIERRTATPPARVPPPHATPLKIARQTHPADAQAPDPKASTAWLLGRVGQLEDENRSAWKDLVGRLAPHRRAT